MQKYTIGQILPGETLLIIIITFIIIIIMRYIGVLRDRARAPQPPTNQPKRHQMSRQGLHVPKKAYIGAKMAVFRPNLLIVLGGNKSSSTNI